MPSKRRHEGYLLIDNGEGPGVTEEFVRASGKNVPVVGAGRKFESATVTCSHCQTIVVLNPQRTRARGYCAKCDHYVCDAPVCNNGECLPYQAKLDRLQEKAFLQQQRGGAVLIKPPES